MRRWYLPLRHKDTKKNLSVFVPSWLMLIVFVILATAFSLVNPIYESTDELHHTRYVRYIQVTGQLPVQSGEGARIQAHHPPLYYLLAALASAWVQPDRSWDVEPEHNPFWQYRAFEVGADNKNFYIHLRDEDFPYTGVTLIVHIARSVNVALGAVMVWLTYRIARRMFPQRPALALGAMAVVAFNPQVLYMSGSVNNDVIAGATGAAVMYAGVDAIGKPMTDRRAAALGALFGLALLAKFNLLFMLPVVELAVWLSANGTAKNAESAKNEKRTSVPCAVKSFLRANVILLAVAGLIAGWWFVRNQMLYGETTGVEKMNALWGGRDPLRDFSLAVQEIPYSWSTLWGRFGYGQIPMPDAVYQIVLVVCLLALVGLWIGWFRHGRHMERTRVAQLGVVAFTVLLFAGAVFGYMTISTAGPNGRFFFPALPALALLIALGLMEWPPLFPLRIAGGMKGGVIIAAMLMLALYALFGVLAPSYARPQPLTEAQIAAIPNRSGVTFDDAIQLAGSDVDTSQVSVGGKVTVSVYWQALKPIDRSYTVFVHLIDADGVIEAQRDTYPGLGNYPTVLWRPGEVFVDRYVVHVPDTAYAPLDTTVRVGLYERGGARRIASNGEDSVPIGRVSIAARSGEYPNSIDLNFDGKVALLGYTLDRRSAKPGESITLTTYWQSLGPTDFDYRIFAHIAAPDDPATIWARTTNGPVDDTRPLSSWAAGEVVIDERVLTLDPNTPSGVYDLQVGWFGKPSSKRLPILAADGHQIGTFVTLTRVRATDP